jgi:hypothetical protein
MKQIRLQIIACFLIFLILDTRPFVNFYLDVNFLLIGAIFFSLRIKSLFLIFTSAVFGVAQDLLLFNELPFFGILLAATVTLIYFCDRKNIFWAVNIFIALVANFLIRALFFGQFSWLFLFTFLIESALILSIMNYFLGPLFSTRKMRV